MVKAGSDLLVHRDRDGRELQWLDKRIDRMPGAGTHACPCHEGQRGNQNRRQPPQHGTYSRQSVHHGNISHQAPLRPKIAPIIHILGDYSNHTGVSRNSDDDRVAVDATNALERTPAAPGRADLLRYRPAHGPIGRSSPGTSSAASKTGRISTT